MRVVRSSYTCICFKVSHQQVYGACYKMYMLAVVSSFFSEELYCTFVQHTVLSVYQHLKRGAHDLNGGRLFLSYCNKEWVRVTTDTQLHQFCFSLCICRTSSHIHFEDGRLHSTTIYVSILLSIRWNNYGGISRLWSWTELVSCSLCFILPLLTSCQGKLGAVIRWWWQINLKRCAQRFPKSICIQRDHTNNQVSKLLRPTIHHLVLLNLHSPINKSRRPQIQLYISTTVLLLLDVCTIYKCPPSSRNFQVALTH